MNTTSNLVIIGVPHHNTLSMIRCVGQEGIKPYVILYGHRDSYIRHSKYIADCKCVDTAEDAVDTFAALCQEIFTKPIVISCSDEVSMIFDARYEEFCPFCHFFNARKAGRVSHFMDKQVQASLASECGLATPWSLVCFPKEAPLDNVTYPCIIKPKESVHGGKRFYICNNNEELKEALDVFDSNYAVLIQQYIQGEYEVVIIGLTVNGHSIIPGFVKKHREYKGATTFSTTYPLSYLPDSVVLSSEKVLDIIGYEGLWGMECIKKGDEYFFIELNLRNDATTYSMAVAGVNLPLVYYNSFPDIGGNNQLSNKVEILDSMVEFDDFNFVLKRTVSFRQWRRELKGCRCRYYYDIDDIAPFRAKIKEYVVFLFNRLFHRT